MTNDEIDSQLDNRISAERKTTNEILRLINLADGRKLYLERGYSSLFDYLVRRFGYLESAAYRRIEAARLLRAVPEAAAKLEAGEINLSNLAKAQSMIRTQEKATRKKLSVEAKRGLVDSVKGKSQTEAQRALIAQLPEAAATIKQERKTVVDEQVVRLALNLPEEVMRNLDRVRDLLSHALPNASYAEVLARVLEEYLEKHDPLRQPTSAAKKRQVKGVSRAVRRLVIQKAGGKCEICGSTYFPQVDHIKPRALGGTNDIQNLRCLCGPHNRMMAEKMGLRRPEG